MSPLINRNLDNLRKLKRSPLAELLSQNYRRDLDKPVALISPPAQVKAHATSAGNVEAT